MLELSVTGIVYFRKTTRLGPFKRGVWRESSFSFALSANKVSEAPDQVEFEVGFVDDKIILKGRVRGIACFFSELPCDGSITSANFWMESVSGVRVTGTFKGNTS